MVPRLAALFSGLLLSLIGFFFFHPLLGVALLLLGGLTWRHPGLGLAAFFVAIPFDLSRPLPGSIFVSFSELELAIVFLVLLATRRGFEDWDWKPLLWWTPFLSAVLISGLVNIQLYKIGPHLLRNAELGMVAFLTFNVYRSRKAGAWLDAALATTLSLQLVLALVELLSSDPGYPVRSTGSMSNANQFGGMIALVVVVSFCRFLAGFNATWKGRRTWQVMLNVWASCGGLFATALSRSRSALLSSAFGVLLGVCLSLRWSVGRPLRGQLWRVLVPLLVIGALAGLLLTQDAVSPIRDEWVRRWSEELDSAVEVRLAIFEVGLDIWMRHPLTGVGPGRWPEEVTIQMERMAEADDDTLALLKARRENWAVFAHSHSLPLQVGAVYGLLGLAGLAYAAMCWWNAYRSCGGPIGDIGLVFILSFAVNNIADSLFPSLAMETGWLLAMLLAVAWQDNAPRAANSPD